MSEPRFAKSSTPQWAYRKSGTRNSKVGPGSQDPQVGPYGGTIRWDPRVGPEGVTLVWDPQVGAKVGTLRRNPKLGP